MGEGENGLSLLAILLPGCTGSLLFFGGKNLLLQRFFQPGETKDFMPLFSKQGDHYHEIFPGEEPILKTEVDLLLCASKTVPSLHPKDTAEDRTGNNDCFLATEGLHFAEKEDEDEKSNTKKVSTFDTQSSDGSRETECETATIHCGSTDPIERREQVEGEMDGEILTTSEIDEYPTSTCSDSSKSTTYSSSCLSDKKEDPLTFFRKFLSTDKERRSQHNLQKTKRRRKRCLKSKASLSHLSPSSLSTNLLGESRSTTHAVFRKYLEEDLKHREPLNKKCLTCDGISICSSCNQKRRDQRSVRFADEEGRDMETVFQISSRHLGACGNNDRRALILLLLPQQQVFEFVGLEYSMSSRQEDKENGQNISISIGKILRELPQLATDPIVSKERYVALLRADAKPGCDAGSPLAASASIQSCNLCDDDVLLAVPSTGGPEVILESSKAILQNKKLLRSVSELSYCSF